MTCIDKILASGTAYYLPGASIGPRINESFLFVRINQGSVRLTLDGTVYGISPGQIVLSPPGTRELWQWDRNCTTVHDFVHWDFRQLPSGLGDPARWHRQLRVPRGGVLQTLFDHVLELDYSTRSQHVIQQHRALELMVTTYVHATDSKVAEATTHEAIEQILDELGRRWARHQYRPPSIADMCRIANLSKPHLTRVFKDACGVSPGRFCEQLRLHVGAHQLASTSASIEAIAEGLGYETQFHFSRNFKKRYQLPPLQFRKRHRHHPEALSDQPVAFLRAYARVQHFSRFGVRAIIWSPD